MRILHTILTLVAPIAPLPLLAETTFRDDRIPLNGTWKFQLRHDNQLLTDGPVRFEPVTASS